MLVHNQIFCFFLHSVYLRVLPQKNDGFFHIFIRFVIVENNTLILDYNLLFFQPSTRPGLLRVVSRVQQYRQKQIQNLHFIRIKILVRNNYINSAFRPITSITGPVSLPTRLPGSLAANLPVRSSQHQQIFRYTLGARQLWKSKTIFKKPCVMLLLFSLTSIKDRKLGNRKTTLKQ